MEICLCNDKRAGGWVLEKNQNIRLSIGCGWIEGKGQGEYLALALSPFRC